MTDKTLSLAKKLISIKSTPENKKALAEALGLVLRELKEYKIEKFRSGDTESILVYNTPKRPKKFRVILNGHLDVIPGKAEQYRPKVKGSRLYGTGSMDMKANVASLIAAFKDVAGKVDYPLGLQIVTDEEVGGFFGTKYQIGKGVRADFVIAGESTDFNIKNKAKGVLWVKVSARGKTAHGAHPWRGDNAIWKMESFLNRLGKKYPVPKKDSWVTTVNLAGIATNNKALNKVPDDCEVLLDVRYVPRDSKKIVGRLKRMLPPGLKMEVIAKESALLTDVSDFYLQRLKKVTEKITGRKIKTLSANGSSDARHFASVGCPGIEFGPVGGDIASDREWVDIPSLGKYRKILTEFLLSL